MLTNILWTDYVAIVILLLLFYYSIVGIKFYSHELKNLLSGKKKLSFKAASSAAKYQDKEQHIEEQTIQSELFNNDRRYVPDGEEQEDTLFQVRELTDNIKEVIQEAVEKEYIKDEFFLSLQLLLKKFTFLKGSPSVAAINNLIASECEKHGYIQLSAEERVLLWNE